jgi:hypothetical protein
VGAPPHGAERARAATTAVAADLRQVLPSWLAARALVAAGYALALWVAQRSFEAGRPPQLNEGLLVWDGNYYRDIATIGYGALPVGALRFFPLYPLLARALDVVLLGHIELSLLLISNGCALALAVVLRRLVLFESHDEDLARRTVWMTALFPSAFVLVLAYAEALFLLLALLTFWGIRRERWVLAAVCGFLAALTRPVGFLLIAPVVVEALRRRRGVSVGEWARRALAVVAPGLGIGLYLFWIDRTYGAPLLPFTAQSDLRGQGANPVVRLIDGVGDLFGPERFRDGLHIPFAIAFLVLLVVVFRRWPLSYGVFAAAMLYAALSATNLNSVERYGLNGFPLILGLASITARPRAERIVLVVSGGGLASLAALAWLGVYVP